MRPRNLLFIMSDEHSKRVLGCHGHPQIKTPNLDGLASRGVRFSDAYCNSPICVPSRASFQTGRYVHDIRFWDNAVAYDGTVPSWAHRLKAAGHRVDSIGKLHFRSAADDNGFTKEHMPLHVVDSIGDPIGLLRDPPPRRKAALKLAADAGRGNSDYQDYDDRITAAAESWLAERAARKDGKPWVLFVSLVCPHFPLIARPEWYDLYPEREVPWPRMYDPGERPRHPFIEAMRACQIYDEGFDHPAKVRKAIAAYFGLVSFVDHNVGRLVRALSEHGLADDTRVIYTSDHGDNVGTRGLWGKSNMYEESVAVPLIMAGPEVPEGVVCRESVSLVDCFPTIIDCVGLEAHPDDRDLPGASLADVWRGTAPERTVMSEYHAAGAATAAFMIRKGRFKYVHYVGMPPQLFDLDADPYEARDLGADAGYRGLVADCKAALRKIVNPEAVDALARKDQAARIAALGGRAAILAKGSFGYSPVPGTKPVYTEGSDLDGWFSKRTNFVMAAEAATHDTKRNICGQLSWVPACAGMTLGSATGVPSAGIGLLGWRRWIARARGKLSSNRPAARVQRRAMASGGLARRQLARGRPRHRRAFGSCRAVASASAQTPARSFRTARRLQGSST